MHGRHTDSEKPPQNIHSGVKKRVNVVLNPVSIQESIAHHHVTFFCSLLDMVMSMLRDVEVMVAETRKAGVCHQMCPLTADAANRAFCLRRWDGVIATRRPLGSDCGWCVSSLPSLPLPPVESISFVFAFLMVATHLSRSCSRWCGRVQNKGSNAPGDTRQVWHGPLPMSLWHTLISCPGRPMPGNVARIVPVSLCRLKRCRLQA